LAGELGVPCDPQSPLGERQLVAAHPVGCLIRISTAISCPSGLQVIAEVCRRADFGSLPWGLGQARKGAALPWTSDARAGCGVEKECGVGHSARTTTPVVWHLFSDTS
jgi:hypothetical protein